MNKRFVFSAIAILAMFFSLVYLVTKPPKITPPWPPERQRMYANKLQAENLIKEAVKAYEDYVDTAPGLAPEVQANVFYTMGKLLKESGDYENALAYFFKAEIAGPNPNIKSDLNEYIVNCLEAMGRGLDAQSKLSKASALEPETQTKGKIVAKIGPEVITEEKINQELQNLPDWMQKEYEDPKKKNDFVKQYIARELLTRKAKRLGYDKDPDIRQKTAEIVSELMLAKLLEEETNKKMNITPDQVELYFKANKDKYGEPAKAKIEFYAAATKEEADAVKTNPKEFTKINGWIYEGKEIVPDIGASKDIVDSAFNADVNQISGPFDVNGKFYLVRTTEKAPAREPAFEEVKDRVKYECEMERKKAVLEELLDDTLKAEDVKIYETNMQN